MTDLVRSSTERSVAGSTARAAAGAPRGVEWQRVCRLDQLTPDRGVAALVGDRQVALFRLSTTGEVVVIDNRDPFSGANVLARGIVGDAGGVPKVASPVYKQAFDLRTGRCLDDAEVSVAVHAARVVDGWVEVATP
jgi:nitrite reductase (NADH) small subunit